MAASFVFITPPVTNKKLLTFDNHGSPEAISFDEMLSYIDKQIIKMYCDLQSTFTKEYINDQVTKKIREISSNILIGNKILEAQVAIIDKYNSEFAKKFGTVIKSSSPVSQNLNTKSGITTAKQSALVNRLSNLTESIGGINSNVLQYGQHINIKLEGVGYIYIYNSWGGDFVRADGQDYYEESYKWIISKA
jgi:hypothetical protein